MTSVLPYTVESVPFLDADPAYQPVPPTAVDDLPHVLLPSGHSAVHLTRYDDVHRVLADPSFSRSVTNVDGGPSFLPTTMPTEMLLNLDVPDHARMKRMVAGPYSAGAIESLRTTLTGVIDDRFDSLRHSENPDLFRDVLDEIPIRVNSAFLGLPLADREYYRPLGHTVQRAPADDVPGLLEDFWKLYEYVQQLSRGERAVTEDGFVSRLLTARNQADPPLTDEETTAILLGSVLGADQNILSVLTKAVYTLLVLQPLWEELGRHPDKVDKTVEELIRLIPLGTISTFPRVATRTIDTTSGTIGPGTVVYADAFAANRDPAAFPEPLAIDPERQGPRHLQFGYGMHHCMGAALARLEITETVRRLTSEFPAMRLRVDPTELSWDTGFVLRRPNTLPVSW